MFILFPQTKKSSGSEKQRHELTKCLNQTCQTDSPVLITAGVSRVTPEGHKRDVCDGEM